MAIASSVLIVLILGASLSRPYLGQAPFVPHPNSLYGGNELRSNGTHDFKRTVLLVSIDGLRYVADYVDTVLLLTNSPRADYLDRGLTPHLLDISKKGLRAKYMKSIFPVSRLLIYVFPAPYPYCCVDIDIPVRRILSEL